MDEMIQTPEGKLALKGYCKNKSREGIDNIGMFAGATAVVVLMTPDSLYCANAGDSRAVLCQGGSALDLSIDHKPDLPVEKRRIEAAGMFVEEQRVNGMLNLSRSLGDLEYKQNKSKSKEEQAVTCYPEVKRFDFNASSEFLIIACDGIWDCLTSAEAVNIFSSKLRDQPTGGKVSDVIADVLDSIIAKDIASSQGIGCDNMTCIVVKFTH
jgi:serine/threonine protein phosphatase PrpC